MFCFKLLFSRLNGDENYIDLDEINIDSEYLKGIRKIYLVACGSAYHASLIGKKVFEKWAEIPVEVDWASEFRYRNPLLNSDDLVIVVSQSGETADTIAAMKLGRSKGAKGWH